MNTSELDRGLERFGGNLARWPAALRAEAERLIGSDPEAARLAAAANRLDALLAETVEPRPVDAALLGRIMAEAGGRAVVNHDPALRPTPRFAAFAGAAMVAFLAAGYVAGLILPATDNEDVYAGLMFGNSRTVTDTDAAATDSGGTL